MLLVGLALSCLRFLPQAAGQVAVEKVGSAGDQQADADAPASQQRGEREDGYEQQGRA